MKRIGVRQLNQETSRVLARVRRGEALEITDRGIPIARLTPAADLPRPLADAVAQGRVTAPVESTPFPAPPRLGDPAIDSAAELTAARQRERW